MKGSLILFALVSLSFLFVASPAYADSPQACERRCDDILDSMTNTTQSGKLTRQYEACMKGCEKLSDAMDEFRSCIKNAHSSSAKEACRSDYRKNRP